MAADELMVYTGMAIVPVIAGVACMFLLRAVLRRTMSLPAACIAFCISLAAGMALSFAYVYSRSSLLHGDGALAIIAAPITGAIVSIPIALIFSVALWVIRPNGRPPGAP